MTMRFPPELYAALKRVAEREQRSLTGQVLYILRRYVEEQAKQAPQP